MQEVSHSILMLAADEPNSMYIIWGALLFGAALILVVLELVIPSGGLIALLATVAVILSVIAFFMYDPTVGFVSLLVYMILTPLVVIFLFKLWMNSPIGKLFVLSGTTDNDEIDMENEEEGMPTGIEERNQRMQKLRGLIGVTGETITPLRPVGTIKIENERIEALAENGTIERGELVIVTEVYDNQVKVRPKN